MWTIGDTIQVNKGEIETLIQIEHPYGLFKCDKYKVCRNLGMEKKHILHQQNSLDQRTGIFAKLDEWE